MKFKIIAILIIICLVLCILNLKTKLKYESENNRLYQSQLNSISKRNEINLKDLQKRNEELKSRNEELKLYIQEADNISKTYGEKYNKKEINKQDCINSHINNDIIKLLQKAGI